MRIIANKVETAEDWWQKYGRASKSGQSDMVEELNERGYTFGHGAIWDKDGKPVTNGQELSPSKGVTVKASTEDITEIENTVKKSIPAKYIRKMTVIETSAGSVDEGSFLIQFEEYFSDKQVELMNIMLQKVSKKLGASISFQESDEGADVTIWSLQY